MSSVQSTTVTVSAKYQIVIPQEIREHFGLKPGQQVRFMVHDGVIVLVPVLSVDTMRGYLKDYDIRLIRDKENVEP